MIPSGLHCLYGSWNYWTKWALTYRIRIVWLPTGAKKIYSMLLSTEEIVGTCESFFFCSNRISNRIGRPIRFRIESSNRPFTTQAVTQPNKLQAYMTACYRPIICWRLALWVLVYFNSVIKRVKQRCSMLILLPKSTLNANLSTTNRFVTNDDWQHGRFDLYWWSDSKFSNLESDVRFDIESNHEASQVPKK